MAEDTALARTTMARGHRRGLMLTALLAVVLCCGLVWGLTHALAESPSPSPAADLTLRLGWTNEPDNLNPFIGYADSTYEIWRINYSTVFGYNQDNGPGRTLRPRCRRRRTAASRPTARSGRSTCAAASSGRTGSRSPPRTSPSPTTTPSRTTCPTGRTTSQGIERVEAVDPTTVRITCSRPRRTWTGQHPDPARAHLVARHAAAGRYELPGQVPDGGQRALPDGRLQEGQLHRDGAATPTTRARRRPSTRSSSRCIRTPTPW